METLPSNRTRYKLALAFWVVLSVVFVAVLVYRIFTGPRGTLWIGFAASASGV